MSTRPTAPEMVQPRRQAALAERGWDLEWAEVLRDLEALRVTRLTSGAATCEPRSTPRGVAGKVVEAAGVALGPPLRFIEADIPAAAEAKA